MNNNEIRDVAVQTAPLMRTPLAPLVAIAGVGVLAYLGIKKLFSEDEEPSETVESTVENGSEPLKDTVKTTVSTVEPTVQVTVSEPLNQPSATVEKSPMYMYTDDSTAEIEEFDELEEETIEESEPKLTDEQIKKELVRQAMSELGKRSAEKRRKNKVS